MLCYAITSEKRIARIHTTLMGKNIYIINHSIQGLPKNIPQQLPCKTISCVLKYPAP